MLHLLKTLRRVWVVAITVRVDARRRFPVPSFDFVGRRICPGEIEQLVQADILNVQGLCLPGSQPGNAERGISDGCAHGAGFERVLAARTMAACGPPPSEDTFFPEGAPLFIPKRRAVS